MVSTNKAVNKNKKLKKYYYIYTLRRDHIIWFVDITEANTEI